MLHGHGGQGRLCGGRPQLQDVEHSEMVPQTGWPAASEGQSGADPVRLRGPGAPGYGGHGQRQRAHAPTDVPDLAGIQGAKSANGPAGGLLLLGAPNGLNGVQQDLAQRGAEHSGPRPPATPGEEPEFQELLTPRAGVTTLRRITSVSSSVAHS